MSRLLARIMLAMLMLPVAVLVYAFLAIALHETIMRRNDERCFIVAGVLTSLFMATWWCLLWVRSVRWTGVRLAVTGVATMIAIGIGTAVAVFTTMTWDDDFGAFIGPPVAIFTWLTLTVFAWRETAGERSERVQPSGLHAVVCPACGYNMTGLRQTTCPECGAGYTIDELLARQPGREADAIEAGAVGAA